MTNFFTLRGCWPKRQEQQPISVELRSTLNTDIIRIQLTSAIYNTDGSIKWADPKIRDLLFSKGAQELALESYVFLYDCYMMRTEVTKETSTGAKNKMAHAYAQDLYLKHIAGTTEYSVMVNGNNETVNFAININGNLSAKLKELIDTLDGATYKTIIDLFEQAVAELVRDVLSLPQQAIKSKKAASSVIQNNSNRTRMFTPPSQSESGSGQGSNSTNQQNQASKELN